MTLAPCQSSLPATLENNSNESSSQALALVIQAFPWSNGITLQQGSMTGIIEQANFGDFPGIDHSLLLVRK